MVFTPIEWMALIVIVLSIVKMAVVLTKPSNWISVVDFVYAKPWLTVIVALVLGGFSLKYLLDAGFTIVHLMAAMFFFMMLMALTYAVYVKDTIVFAKKLLKDKSVLKRGWLPILIWLVLIVWALKELFM